jgi:hypothetical protein
VSGKNEHGQFTDTQPNRGFDAGCKCLKNMARPEGLEPPTLCLEGISGLFMPSWTRLQVFAIR